MKTSSPAIITMSFEVLFFSPFLLHFRLIDSFPFVSWRDVFLTSIKRTSVKIMSNLPLLIVFFSSEVNLYQFVQYGKKNRLSSSSSFMTIHQCCDTCVNIRSKVIECHFVHIDMFTFERCFPTEGKTKNNHQSLLPYYMHHKFSIMGENERESARASEIYIYTCSY